MDTIKIKTMSIKERLLFMEALWDSFLNEEREIDSPEWHGRILEERKRKIENNEAEFITIEKLKLES